MMNEDELIAEMVDKAEALGYRKGFKQGLLRAAEILVKRMGMNEDDAEVEAIRAEAEKS